MYVFVPAFMSLWSYHDEVNMHHRRYTNAELKSKIIALLEDWIAEHKPLVIWATHENIMSDKVEIKSIEKLNN